jgi:hypothetical protein
VADSRILAALDAAAAAGPFYVLDTDPPPTVGGDVPGWRRFRELVADPTVLAARVAAVTDAVAERAGLERHRIDRRAAVSLTHLGLAARLVCPSMGTALLGGVLLDLDPARLWWRDVLGPVPLALPDPTGRPAPTAPDDLVRQLSDDLAAGPVAALTAAAADLGVSRKVLWGNVASALAGTLPALTAAAGTRAGAARAVVTGLLATGILADTGSFRGPGGSFVRNSCCLYYRVPGGGYCGDCLLAAPPPGA